MTFIPLLMDTLAYTYAYHTSGKVQPPACKKVNGTYVYPNTTGCIRCRPTYGDQLYFSETVSEDLPDINILPGLPPSAFALIIVAISVFFQALAFTSFGALADYSGLRKQMLLLTAFGGAVVTILYITVPLDAAGTGILAAAILAVVSNVLFGLSTVFYNAFLPFLSSDHPKIHAARQDPLKKAPEELSHIEEVLQSRISSIGIIAGYVAGVFLLLVGGLSLHAVGAFEDDATEVTTMRGYVWAIIIAATWWLVGTVAMFWIHPWPGKPLPEGTTSYIALGWRQTFQTFREAHKLPHTFRFIMLYFFYSDGINTTASVGLLFAKRDMCGNALEQFIIALLVPTCAFLGNWLFFQVHTLLRFSPMQTLRLCLGLYMLLPVWGLVGYLPHSPIGFRNLWEIYFLGAWFGLILGAQQSYSRTVFMDLIPPGREAQFFSLYALTDKGSSWIGPLVVAMLTTTNLGGVMRIAFGYLFVVVLIPLIGLGFVNVEEGRVAARDLSQEGIHKGGSEGNKETIDESLLIADLAVTKYGSTIDAVK